MISVVISVIPVISANRRTGEGNLISRNQLSLAKSIYKIKILWQMYILIALFSSKKVNGLMDGTSSQNNKF